MNPLNDFEKEMEFWKDPGKGTRLRDEGTRLRDDRESMYMGGRGILRHTEKLNDRLWDTMPGAIIGTSAVILGPLLAWATLIEYSGPETPPTMFHWIAAAIITVVSTIGGVWIACPWFVALRVLRIHRKNMERETAARGPGWARD